MMRYAVPERNRECAAWPPIAALPGLVRGPLAATRAAAESLRRTAWQIIAASFHPATQQWAGPHSRAYSDTITPKLAADLAAQCPADLAPRFGAPPFDAVYELGNLRRDSYDAMAVAVRQAFHKQYEWMASYTRSRAFSTAATITSR